MTGDDTDIGPVGVPHVPVMEGKVVEGLRPRPGARIVDATVGAGGHARALLAAAPGSVLLGIDRDPAALAIAAERLAPFGTRVTLREGTFGALPALLADHGWADADAVLLDLGVSSLQLDDPARGFSFRGDGPLDMRMGRAAAPTAAEIVNEWEVEALASLLADYGEEPRAGAVARAIVAARPLRTTAALARTVAGAAARPRPGIHPATRSFQALRMAVNDELRELEQVLESGWELLAPAGRLGILAYHSLEDRRAKVALRRWAASCLCPPGLPVCSCGWSARVRLIGRRALRPSAEEIARNPRCRSARWRVVERLGGAS